MQRRVAISLVLVLTLAATVCLPAVADGDRPQVSTPEGFDDTAFEITVYANGSAQWTVEHAKQLENDSQVDTFEDYAQRFNTEETDLVTDFRSRSRTLVTNISDSLGREMTAEHFAREASVSRLGPPTGVVRLSFTWSNFARRTDDRVVVADVFGGGMYVGPGQDLVFSHGPDLRFVDTNPSPPDELELADNLTGSAWVSWQGERDFGDRHPRIELADPATAAELAGGSTASQPTDDPTTDGSEAPGAGEPSGGMGLPMLGLLVLLVVGAAGGVAWYTGVLSGDRRDDGAAVATTAETGAGDVEPAAPDEPDVAESAVPDEELLTDEDRVVSLLEDNGGRMKQVKIVDETDWSKSKVSMLLSDMEEEGQISKLRVGRENIVSLAGQEPEAAGSPFDDEE